MFRARAGTRNLAAALRDRSSPKAGVRADALADLATHAEAHRDEVVAALREGLDDDADEVRAAAALALADAGASEAAEALIAALPDAPDEVAAMVICALGELRATAAREAVGDALGHRSPPVRFQAVMAFPRVCSEAEANEAALLEATHDDDALVRHIALRMAEELGGDEDAAVSPGLLDRAAELLDDEADVVRLAAAIILGRSGRDDGAAVLVEVVAGEVATSEADDEAAAVELCGELGLPEAVPALERRAWRGGLLTSRDGFAWQARVALAQLGRPRAENWILSELTAWNRERRSLAVAAIARAPLPAARPLLEAMVGDDSRADPDRVREALDALDAARNETASGKSD